MKIMFIVASYYPEGAGAGRSVRNLAEGVHQAGHQVSVVRLTPDKLGRTETINGVTVHYLPIRNLYYMGKGKRPAFQRLIWHTIDIFNPWAAYDFWQILRHEKPDVINTSVIAGFSTSIFLVARLLGIKLVHTMRDYYLMCPQNAMYRNGHNCEKICAGCKPFFHARRFQSRWVNLFLSNSAFVKHQHESLGFLAGNKPCHVQFNMNEDDAIDAPRTLKKSKPIRFGFIGRIDPTKGIDILLQATQHLATTNWQLEIAGKGPDDYIHALKQRFPGSNIKFVGFAEPNAFYRNIDILICPSVYGEPLPRVVYEAYRAAVPVIAAATGGIPEIVDEGRTGFTYAPTNSIELARHMDILATQPNLYEELSRHAAKKAEIFKKSAITADFLRKLELIRHEA